MNLKKAKSNPFLLHHQWTQTLDTIVREPVCLISHLGFAFVILFCFACNDDDYVFENKKNKKQTVSICVITTSSLDVTVRRWIPRKTRRRARREIRRRMMDGRSAHYLPWLTIAIVWRFSTFPRHQASIGMMTIRSAHVPTRRNIRRSESLSMSSRESIRSPGQWSWSSSEESSCNEDLQHFHSTSSQLPWSRRAISIDHRAKTPLLIVCESIAFAVEDTS